VDCGRLPHARDAYLLGGLVTSFTGSLRSHSCDSRSFSSFAAIPSGVSRYGLLVLACREHPIGQGPWSSFGSGGYDHMQWNCHRIDRMQNLVHARRACLRGCRCRVRICAAPPAPPARSLGREHTTSVLAVNEIQTCRLTSRSTRTPRRRRCAPSARRRLAWFVRRHAA